MRAVNSSTGTTLTENSLIRNLEISYCTSARCQFETTCILALVLFLQGLLVACATTPFRSEQKRPQLRHVYSLLNILTSGACFATALLHLMPDSVDYLSSKPLTLSAYDVEVLNSTPFLGPATIITLTFPLFLLLKRVPHTRLNMKTRAGKLWPYDQLEKSSVGAGDGPGDGDGKEEASKPTSILGECVHVALQSIALGLCTNWNTRLTLFAAVSAHRTVDSIACQPSFARAQSSNVLQSALSVGIAAVVFLCGTNHWVSRLRGITFALTSGAYLYFGAFEILASEMIEQAEILRSKFVYFTIGNAVVVAVSAFVSFTANQRPLH